MKEQESQELKKRLESYETLKARRSKLQDILTKLTEDWKDGPCGKGPFTGNTRESRTIRRLDIHFSATLGGAESVEATLYLADINLSAYSFGQYLKEMTEKAIQAINTQINEL